MSARDPLQVLIEKWREQLDMLRATRLTVPQAQSVRAGQILALSHCVYQLEDLALRAVPVQPQQEQIALIREMLTCRNGSSHYCPNCDNTIGDGIIEAITRALPAAPRGEEDRT